MRTGTTQASTQIDNRRGFTIVELLIVVVVIAILAAITIVAYNGITNRATVAATQSGVEQAAKKVLSYMVLNDDQVPTNLATAGFSASGGTTFQYSTNTSATPQVFCITATTGKVSYYIDNGAHTNPTVGGCPGDGVGGVAAITNLLVNPSAEVSTNYITIGNSTVVARTSSEHYSGVAAVQVTANGLTGGEGVLFYSYIGGMSGRAYSGGVWVKAPAGTALYMTIRTESPTASEDNPKTFFTATGSWQLLKSENKIAQSDAVTAQVHVRTNTTQAVVFYADAAIIVEGASLGTSFADGSSPGWKWNGALNNSTSTGPPL